MTHNDESKPAESSRKSRSSERASDIDAKLNSMIQHLEVAALKNLPRSLVQPGVADLEVDELVQNALIKLWLAMQKGCIAHLKAYGNRIVYNESIDMMRRSRRKPNSPLSLDEHGELSQGQMIASTCEPRNDPAYMVEERDTLMGYKDAVVDDILELPEHQKWAMICELKNEPIDLRPILDEITARGVDITNISWSQDSKELHTQRVSLAIAQKKMRKMREKHVAH